VKGNWFEVNDRDLLAMLAKEEALKIINDKMQQESS
jgi:hypothetical protein